MLFEEGLENVFRRHRLLAEAVRRAVGVWAEGQAIGFNIIEPAERSNSVTCVLMNGHDPEALRAYCNQKCGVILGQGIGELSGKAFRIAHMGHVNAPMILGTLERDRDRRSPRSASRTARAAPRPRSTGWASRSRRSPSSLAGRGLNPATGWAAPAGRRLPPAP